PDGSVRDVTRLSSYASSAEKVATVDDTGRVLGRERGHAAIIVHYRDLVAARTLTFVEDVPGFVWDEPGAEHPIDALVDARLELLAFEPATIVDDGTFLRRLFLSVRGRLPTLEETREFLADDSPEKRERWIDRAIASDEAAELDALRFSDRLRVTPARYGARGARKIHRFLVDAFRENMPYDELARRILTASGSDADAPEAGFWRAVSDAEDASEAVAQAFLGIRMQCAKCHNHPTERFTQDDYHGLKAVFAQTRTKRGRGSDVTVVYTDSTVEIRHPRTGEVVAPAVPLGGRLERTGADEDDRRVRFANWLVAPENPLFSRVEANRIWAALFGR